MASSGVTDNVADLSELHTMAQRLGLHRRHLHNPRPGDRPHYDLLPSKRSQAVACGAVETSGRTIVKIMWARRAYLKARKAEKQATRVAAQATLEDHHAVHAQGL
jgi:hypothetical protein